jgi:hypothetical protein
MADAAARKTTPANGDKPVTTANSVAPTDPTRLQMGQKVDGLLSTNPPRGVDEPPSDQIADEPGAAALQGHVQETINRENEQGWRGARQGKPVPNSHYTLAGVNAGKPTPETVVHTPTSE